MARLAYVFRGSIGIELGYLRARFAKLVVHSLGYNLLISPRSVELTLLLVPVTTPVAFST